MAGSMGKKIDTLDVQTEAGTLKVLIYMAKDRNNQVSFTGVCDAVQPRYHKRMADVNELQADARKTVKQLASIVWEKKILVRTNALVRKQEEDGFSGRQNSELAISWQVVEVGTRPDGQQVHRYLDRHGPYRSHINQHALEEQEFAAGDSRSDWLDDEKGSATTLLPFTPENVEALTSVCDRLAQMALTLAGIPWSGSYR